MTVCLLMLVRDEEHQIRRAIESTLLLIDSWVILDTGSTDNTETVAREALDGVPGQYLHAKWRNFGAHRTRLLKASQGKALWRLMIDADMTVEHHPDLKPWLDSDPDPAVNAWQVEIHDSGTRWLLPSITRGSVPARYVGETHEYLSIEGKQRPLLGLVCHHHPDADRANRNLELKLQHLTGDDPRTVFYRAETLRFLGRTSEAAADYDRRAAMGGFEEERWYAAYQAASLREDVNELLAVWRTRPWRHEPLTAASRIVAAAPNTDVLFRETA